MSEPWHQKRALPCLREFRAWPCFAVRSFWGCTVFGLACFLNASLAAAEGRLWHQEAGARWTELQRPSFRENQAGFTLLTPQQTGIDFTNVLLEFSAATNRILENGAGLAVGDYDQDGRLDIFVCGLDSPSALYRNLGQWRFTNVISASGLGFPDRYQRGAVFADINGDGALDLLVSTLNQGVLCFVNDGQGHFRDETAAAGTRSKFGSVTMALADIDGNGTLDLYVTNYRAEDIRNRGSVQVYRRNGAYVIPPEFTNRLTVVNGIVREFGDPDILYLNDGHGHFTPVSWTGGRFLDEEGRPLRQPPLDWGQTAAFRDLDGDGSPDLYVCNDYWTVDRIWMNDGQGIFRAIAPAALRHVCFSSMGVDFADINRDGFVDFLVTDMQSRDARLRKRQMYAFNPQSPPFDPMRPPPGIVLDRPQVMRNALYLNRGDNTYADIAEYAGVPAAEWAWQQVFLDVDLDGFEDLLIASGFYRDVQDRDAIAATSIRRPAPLGVTNQAALQLAFALEKMTNSRLFPPYQSPIVAFRNSGSLQFRDVTDLWGTGQPGIHQAIAVGDLDDDGDLDLAVNNLNGPLGLYRNHSPGSRLAVRLRGRPPNTQGIGAKITLRQGAIPQQSQEVACGGRYLSGSEPTLMFATGPSPIGMTLEVRWRSGQTTRISAVEANRLYEIQETIPAQAASPDHPLEPLHRQGLVGSPPLNSAPTGFSLFRDVSEKLNHSHEENPCDDFARQPLLPHKLSRLGPGLAWWDLDGDGHDDLMIGAGAGGFPAVFLGDGQGGFRRSNHRFCAAATPADQTGILGWTPAPGQSVILAARANDEDPAKITGGVIGHDWSSQASELFVSGLESSIGPMALADLDGSGHLALFVGGRVRGGRWPEPASSRIYQNKEGALQIDLARSEPLKEVGLVTAAVFSDLDGDGLPELVLACEWGPIRVFGMRNGRFGERTTEFGLIQFTGFWNGVTTGDLDGDGRLDIVAANWGLNSPYRASSAHPLEVYYGDFSGRGWVDVVEAEFETELQAVAPRRDRDVLAASLPFLIERFPTHKAFSEASVADVLGPGLAKVRRLEVTTLASTVFFNRGGRFEAVPLPPDAQFAPASGVVVADFNGDGFEDVFLSQNCFDSEPGLPRSDAGRGLLLLGDGTGSLRPVSGQDSGIIIYGQQRGAAASDFNEDGRIDLVVGQNGAATRLFQNLGAKPGLRVRLVGPAGNPLGIGAVLRWRSASGSGPAHEVHAGSGYLSQDSAVSVLASTGQPIELEVRWPGGKTTRMSVSKSAQEIRVEAK